VVALLVWTVGVAPVTYFWLTALTHGWTPGSWILVALAVAALGAGMTLAYREKLRLSWLLFVATDVVLVSLGMVFMEL
jgi:hypothetical protein